MDLTDKNREAVFALPPEKKWQIYCSKKKVLFCPLLLHLRAAPSLVHSFNSQFKIQLLVGMKGTTGSETLEKGLLFKNSLRQAPAGIQGWDGVTH